MSLFTKRKIIELLEEFASNPEDYNIEAVADSLIILAGHHIAMDLLAIPYED